MVNRLFRLLTHTSIFTQNLYSLLQLLQGVTKHLLTDTAHSLAILFSPSAYSSEWHIEPMVFDIPTEEKKIKRGRSDKVIWRLRIWTIWTISPAQGIIHSFIPSLLCPRSGSAILLKIDVIICPSPFSVRLGRTRAL